jgi:hypothetical protein
MRTVGRPLRIFCDSAELAVECAQWAAELDLPVDPRVIEHLGAEVSASEGDPAPLGIALGRLPDAPELVALSGHTRGRSAALALIACGPGTAPAVALARDLGITAVTEVRPMLAVLALEHAGADRPWAAAVRALSDPDRARMAAALGNPSRQGGQLVSMGGGRVGFVGGDGQAPRAVGEAREVAEAVAALRESAGAGRSAMPSVEGVAPQTVLDVIFGPPRALSDPASKAALAPYDLPLPTEELCTSTSRAAAEATRIGFPVRIALASPDLRVADHPDLSMDGIDNAARVRDVYRQLMALGQSRSPSARLLGVTVSATTPAHALLRIRITPLPEGLARCDLAFADGHGLASGDATCTVLPAPPARLEQAIGRLAGSGLILQGTAADRRRTVTALLDVLLRAAAFVHDFRAQVDAVTLDPLALLVGGGIEVREACVVVGDAFERSLAAR